MAASRKLFEMEPGTRKKKFQNPELGPENFQTGNPEFKIFDPEPGFLGRVAKPGKTRPGAHPCLIDPQYTVHHTFIYIL